MAQRPTERWRARGAEEVALIARGELDPDDAYAAHLWSEELIAGTDAVLEHFERAIGGIDPTSDDAITDAVKTVVLALNKVNRENRDHGRIGYETGEREQLCEFIELTLAEARVDVDGYADRFRIARHELTDEWREW